MCAHVCTGTLVYSIYVCEGQRFTLGVLSCSPLHCGCIYVYVCACMSVCITYMFICMHMYVQVYWYMCIYVYRGQRFTLGILSCSSLCLFMCVLYVCICACMYVFMYICIHSCVSAGILVIAFHLV